MDALEKLGIDFRENLAILESLSKASDRLTWQSQGLPNDQLSLENGAILANCVRFPFVIDPSGHAIDFLMKKHSSDKIQKTSFHDKAFMKTLAGAVRFGTSLLVENVEAIDPVLNPVLNREIQRTGGRSLIRIGTEDVDYSPKFFIILTTKNPAVHLTPDLCSRVTLINFTVTPASLQSQSLSRIVKEEKPDLESQRSNLLKLQGEQNVKLRELEDQMLSSISAVEGSILDDDRVVSGMEILMKEGALVEEQISNSAEVMKQVQAAVGKFEPLANICRDLFVLMEGMREISFLYEFSANSFYSVLDHVLKTPFLQGQTDLDRMNAIKTHLFSEIAARIGRSLLVEDKLVFSLLLARLYTGNSDIGLKLHATSTVDVVKTIMDVFGENFPWSGRGLNSLKSIQENEISASVPLMLCSAPGHDVSGRVEFMARELNKELSSVAMGSPEGYETADKFVSSAAKRGTWVMLKNCHLCTDWLRDTFVKRLQSFGSGTHPDFRIFMTSEINPELPTALLRISDIIVAEAPTGVKASLSRFITSIAVHRLTNHVRNRIYLGLAWVHSVVQERLRYVPIGWTEKYEFTEADALHALDVIDALLEVALRGRPSLDPEKLPWASIRSTLCHSVFGGRITKQVDQEVLDALVGHVFNANCFDVNFKLVDVEGGPTLPDGNSAEEIFEWIETLPSHTPPTWVGLDSEAEAVRELKIADSVLKKTMVVSQLISYDE
jgi:dynein heavy chain 1, cytosolic